MGPIDDTHSTLTDLLFDEKLTDVVKAGGLHRLGVIRRKAVRFGGSGAEENVGFHRFASIPLPGTGFNSMTPSTPPLAVLSCRFEGWICACPLTGRSDSQG